MARCEHWPRELVEYVERRRAMPFEWGKNDCCMFVLDWLLILTGKEAAPKLRGKYTTEKGAARIIARRGGDLVKLADGVCAEHGWPRVIVTLARRGDVVAQMTPTGACLGVCMGAQTACVAAGGLVMLPTESGVAAWRIE